MKRTPLKRLGKRGMEWERVRRELKARFLKAGITECEVRGHGCWHDNGLGFMHAKKRRNLGPGELSVVVLACNICHDQWESGSESKMEQMVLDIIARRPNPV